MTYTCFDLVLQPILGTVGVDLLFQDVKWTCAQLELPSEVAGKSPMALYFPLG